MPSVVPTPTTLGCAASMDPQCCGWQTPFPERSAPLIFPDHFKMVTSSWASREGTEVPPSRHFCRVHWWKKNVLQWLGRQMGEVSKLCLQHTRAMHRENKEIDGAGWSLLRLMGTPKYKANHNGCCSILSLGQRFFCFVLFCFEFLYLFVVCRGLGAGSVCVWFVYFSPLVFLLLKHTEGTFVYSITNKRIVRTL